VASGWRLIRAEGGCRSERGSAAGTTVARTSGVDDGADETTAEAKAETSSVTEVEVGAATMPVGGTAEGWSSRFASPPFETGGRPAGEVR
jgi:hypothetical protein